MSSWESEGQGQGGRRTRLTRLKTFLGQECQGLPKGSSSRTQKITIKFAQNVPEADPPVPWVDRPRWMRRRPRGSGFL